MSYRFDFVRHTRITGATESGAVTRELTGARTIRCHLAVRHTLAEEALFDMIEAFIRNHREKKS